MFAILIELRQARIVSYQYDHMLLLTLAVVLMNGGAVAMPDNLHIPALLETFYAARPANPSPSPYFVPGLPHVILIELRQALISYEDDRMLLLTLYRRVR